MQEANASLANASLAFSLALRRGKKEEKSKSKHGLFTCREGVGKEPAGLEA